MSLVAVPILRYGSVLELASGDLAPLNVTPAELEAHLELVTSARATPISLVELVVAIRSDAELPRHPVVFSFERPGSTLESVLPLFAERELPSTFFLTATEAGSLGVRLAKIEQLGGEIGTMLATDHGSSLRDLVSEKSRLEAFLGHLVEVAAFAPGLGGARLCRLLEGAGYEGACATNEAVSSNHDNLFGLSRVTIDASTPLGRVEELLSGRAGPVAPGAYAAGRSLSSRLARHRHAPPQA